MGRQATALACVVGLLAAPLEADGDPVRFPAGGRCEAPSGASITLASGAIVLTAEEWQALDAEVIRLQVAETRLSAENKVLKVKPSTSSFLATLVTVAVVAFGVGYAKGAL